MDIKNIELKEYLQKFLGEELLPFLHSRPEPPAIRINRLKTTRDKFLHHLGKLGQTYRVIPFNPDGLIIDHDDLPLSHSLAFFTGQFNYQGIASQLPVILLDVRPGEKVLDMAASPGSKSTQIAGHLQQTGLLILNDPSMERLQALNANMQKSGAVNHYTLKMRGERFGTLYPEYFDKILIDAPCTALGNLSENHEVHHWWSLEKLRKLNNIQDHMLIAAYKSLRAGGEMVYSTCSVAPEENELVVQRLLDKYPVSVLPPPEQIARQFDQGYSRYRDQRLHPDLCHAVRVLPHKHQMEGFFAVRLRKEDAFKNDPDKHIDLSPTMISTDPDVAVIDISLKDSDGLDLIRRLREQSDSVRMVVSSMHDESFYARRSLRAGALGYVSKENAASEISSSVQPG